MGKMYYALTLILLFQIGIYLFYGTSLPSFALLSSIAGIQDWSANSFITYLAGAIGIVGVALIFTSPFTKATELVYLGIAATFFQFGMAYFEAYNYMKEANILGSSSNPILLMLIFIPLIISWFVLVLEFGRGRD
jgi:hypothetical protein